MPSASMTGTLGFNACNGNINLPIIITGFGPFEYTYQRTGDAIKSSEVIFYPTHRLRPLVVPALMFFRLSEMPVELELWLPHQITQLW
ncbi:MAG: hypothetical protein IPO04_14470 [Cytophagaceae bacterium]|nr:hypothetical protein [Cytophagaceae bacterium]